MEKSEYHFGNAANPADVKGYKRCKLANGTPCIPCSQAIKLNDLIIQARKTLNDLLCQKRDLHTEINFSHDRIIHRLPPELSTSIFRLSLSEEEPISLLDMHRPESAIFITTPLTLGAVCRVWRNIAWATPALWTKISIPLKHGTGYNYLDIGHDWFKRSGQLPLSIFIYTPQFQTTVDEDPDFDLLEQLSNLINSCLHRCLRLEICCPAGDLLPTGIQGDAPILHEIMITSDDQPGSDNPLIELRSLRSEGIRVSVIGYCLESLVLPFENVREFECLLEWYECVWILQQCPNLQQYEIRGLTETADAEDDDPIITHESLKKLALYSEENPSSPMLETFQLPSLIHLMVSDGDASSIHSFILRSCCNLRYLWLKSLNFDGEELKNLLRSTYFLEELHLIEDNVVDFDFDVLFRDLAPNPVIRDGRYSTYLGSPLLPNLSVLTIKFREEENFPWDLAAEIFGSLDDMRDPRRRPIKDFRIMYGLYTGNSRHAAEPHDEPSESDHPVPSPTLILNEELTRRFLDICGEGVNINLYDTSAKDDILRLAMVHHNIPVPEWYETKEQVSLKMARWSAAVDRAFED